MMICMFMKVVLVMFFFMQFYMVVGYMIMSLGLDGIIIIEVCGCSYFCFL